MWYILLLSYVPLNDYVNDQVEVIEYNSYWSANGFFDKHEVCFWGWYENEWPRQGRELHIIALRKQSLFTHKPFFNGQEYVLIWTDFNCRRRVTAKMIVDTEVYESKGGKCSDYADAVFVPYGKRYGFTSRSP